MLAGHGVQGRPFASKAVVSRALVGSASGPRLNLDNSTAERMVAASQGASHLTFRSRGGELPASPTRFRGLRLPVHRRSTPNANWPPAVT